MIQLNTYLFEKLKISKSTEVDNSYYPNVPIYSIWLEDFEDEDTLEVVTILRNCLFGNFKKVEEDKIFFDNGDSYEDIFLNKNGYYQTKDFMIFLPIKDAKLFCERILKEEDFIEKGIFNFFESKPNTFSKAGWADDWFKKMLRSINAKLSKIHK